MMFVATILPAVIQQATREQVLLVSALVSESVMHGTTRMVLGHVSALPISWDKTPAILTIDSMLIIQPTPLTVALTALD